MRNEGGAARGRVIRALEAADGPLLRDLYIVSLRHNPGGFVQDLAYHGDIVERAAVLQGNQGDMLGLFQSADLLGFGGLKKQRDDGHVELCNLHVHPGHLRRGLGRDLARALLARARELGYHTVNLQVTVTQSAALRLYEGLGFRPTERETYHVAGQAFETQFMTAPLAG